MGRVPQGRQNVAHRANGGNPSGNTAQPRRGGRKTVSPSALREAADHSMKSGHPEQRRGTSPVSVLCGGRSASALREKPRGRPPLPPDPLTQKALRVKVPGLCRPRPEALRSVWSSRAASAHHNCRGKQVPPPPARQQKLSTLGPFRPSSTRLRSLRSSSSFDRTVLVHR
jgi:hypothetical protein